MCYMSFIANANLDEEVVHYKKRMLKNISDSLSEIYERFSFLARFPSFNIQRSVLGLQILPEGHGLP